MTPAGFDDAPGIFASFGRVPSAPVRLLCLPHAGGGCTSFRTWPAQLGEVDVLAVQPPGRGPRLSEPAPDSLPAAAQAIVEALGPLLDRPYAVFGHCLGGLLGFEVVRQLRRRGLPEPVHLFAAAAVAPHLVSSLPRLAALPDGQFRAAVLALGGTAESLAANNELFDLLLPAIRADFRLGETYRADDERPLACPITVFAGDADDLIGDGFDAWAQHTSGRFQLVALPGGHFCLNNELPQVIAVVRRSFDVALHSIGTARDEPAIARWATALECRDNRQRLEIPTGPRATTMAGACATGEALVSNGRLGADIIRLAGGERFQPHTHPGDHLLVVLAGEGTVTQAGHVHATSAGDIYLVEGGVPHAVGALTDHVILSVGAPHRAVDSPDRQTSTDSKLLSAPTGELACRLCDLVAVAPDRLCDLGCTHCPCGACSGQPAPAASDGSPIPRWPKLEPEDIRAGAAVLRSGRLSQASGSAVADFENALAEYHRTAQAVALSSGTAALELTLAALDIGPGDEVVVPSHTFVASASPILKRGARPVFVDADATTFCLAPASVAAALTERTRAIVAVHLNGHPAELPELLRLGRCHGIPVIEDTAQAIGARWGEQPAGAFGVAGCFSFWEDKIITTAGEGGAVLTADEGLAERIRRLRHHGEDRLAGTTLFASHVLGGNHRLTAVQAAIGRSQLRRLDTMLAARRRNAARLSADLSDGVDPPVERPGCTHAYWKYVCRLRTAEVGCDIDTFVAALQRRGIPALRRYPVPVHRHPLFRDRGFGREDLPITDALAGELFSLPVHPLVTDGHIDQILEAVAKAVVECAA